ncbi:hypothetical protein BHE74_00003083 [Ensete ventricosum]|nr:hypothetical protein GW17_00014837 [Ensete ventricosum]RWW88056.1 hypothetical protein BHE74_00003083 [Ensete ventricosum]
MARLALLLSHARRHYHRLRPLQIPLSSPSEASPVPSFFFSRSFSSSSPISPVSYPVKPKDPDEEESPDASKDTPSPPSPPPRLPRAESQVTDGGSRPWTRADARFVKDGPAISPVSYPARVAPLPEYRAPEPEETKGDDGQLQREARRIQSGARARSFFDLQEEPKIPFPTLIVPDRKSQKVPMDLMEAIRQANAKRKFVETMEAHVNLGVDPRRGDQTVRVAVFAELSAADEARAAGADIVGGDELIEEIKNGAVKEAKSGRVDFKIDKTAIVHVGLGKV